MRYVHDAVLAATALGSYPIVRWRDRWGTRWEHKQGVVPTDHRVGELDALTVERGRCCQPIGRNVVSGTFGMGRPCLLGSPEPVLGWPYGFSGGGLGIPGTSKYRSI